MTAFALTNITLLAILAVTALAIARIRARYEATMLATLFSLVTATLFVLLDAVDVAFTEAAAGVGISTVVLLGVLALTRSWEAVTPPRRRLPGLAVVLLAGATLGYASQDLPAFGTADSPVQTHPVTDTHLYQSEQDIGIPTPSPRCWRATAPSTRWASWWSSSPPASPCCHCSAHSPGRRRRGRARTSTSPTTASSA